MGLELGEGHLDRVEVGRVGRQEQEPGALGAEDLGGPGTSVHREVVEHDDVALAEAPARVGFRPRRRRRRGSSARRAARAPPADRSAGRRRRSASLVAQRRVVAHPRAPPRPPAQPRHVGPGAAFVDEDQPVRLLAHPRLAPARPVGARRAHVGALPTSLAISDFFCTSCRRGSAPARSTRDRPSPRARPRAPAPAPAS